MHHETTETLTMRAKTYDGDMIRRVCSGFNRDFLVESYFRRCFPIWLSDLHIGRIIVLEGANLIQFENDYERRWALAAVNERQTEKTQRYTESFIHC